MTTFHNNFQQFVTYISENKLAHIITPEFMAWLISSGYFTAPASTKYHGAHEGGLWEHSFAVTKELTSMCNRNFIGWDRPESAYIVGLFHDLCKCDQYLQNEDGTYSYNAEADRRHAEKSIEILRKFIDLTEEEELCIRYHMGAYKTEDWQNHNHEMDDAISKYETVLWTHWADMRVSHVFGN